MSYLFGFIGTGNMGSALARAARRATDSIILSNRTEQKARDLAMEIGAASGSVRQVAMSSRYLFLGVKPQMMRALLQEIAEVLADRDDVPVLVSMAAGLTTDAIRSYAGGDYPVIRIMPNTPVSVGEGEILYCTTPDISGEQLTLFLDTMRYSGTLTLLTERLMDAGTSVSGCGPAFVYMFIRALAKGGVDAGIDEATSLQLAAQTVIGAGRLLQDSSEPPDMLIDRVCSPGGSTIEGVRSLEQDDMEQIVSRAVAAAYRRNRELSAEN